MYTKEEIKELRLKFWADFKEYCQNHPDPELRRKRWLLNNTGVNGVVFRFDFDRENAKVMIELQHRNEDRRLRTYEIMEWYKVVMENGFENGLNWEFYHRREDNQQEVCRIFASLERVDFHRQNQWHQVFEFFVVNMKLLEENFLLMREVLKNELKK